jgi:SNW domain-containing protein 1
MRLAANGRSLENHTINERFSDMVDTLLVAEQTCRAELEELAKVQKSVSYKEHLLKEERMKA